MPLLRLMSGSNQDRDIEEGMMASIVTNISEDGLIYDRATPNRPWNVGFGYGTKGWNEDYANMAGNGRLLTGLLYYYQATGDEVWKERAQRTAERMLELAIVKGEYAYYPADEYDCEFLGNTAISVGEPEPPGERYRIFQREHLRTDKAPMKEMSSYVHGKVIRWSV